MMGWEKEKEQHRKGKEGQSGEFNSTYELMR